jgi:hypothetical protein
MTLRTVDVGGALTFLCMVHDKIYVTGLCRQPILEPADGRRCERVAVAEPLGQLSCKDFGNPPVRASVQVGKRLGLRIPCAENPVCQLVGVMAPFVTQTDLVAETSEIFKKYEP